MVKFSGAKPEWSRAYCLTAARLASTLSTHARSAIASGPVTTSVKTTLHVAHLKVRSSGRPPKLGVTFARFMRLPHSGHMGVLMNSNITVRRRAALMQVNPVGRHNHPPCCITL